MNKFGINDARDSCYGSAAALSYWVFRCRDRQKSPAMGTKTWTFLESAIQNSAEVSTTIEDYLQYLSNQLIANLRPSELVWIVQPSDKIIRLNELGEIQERNDDQNLNIYSWKNIVEAIAIDGFSEWDILELCRTKASIIQVLVRLRFEVDRALGKDIVDDSDIIEVEVK
jgi:hypothetical protein